MEELPALKIEDADNEAKRLLEEIEQSAGMLPNIYKVIANSTNALKSYLQFSEAQKKGSFSSREREAIYLSASEENGCSYCIAAHSEIARRIGFREEDIIKLRAGTYPDKRLNSLTYVAKSIINKKGNIDKSLISVFYEAGFNEKALVDLVALVTEVTFTNYIARLSRTEIDFPLARLLNESVLT